MSKFEIKRRSTAPPISIVIAAAAARGVFFMRSTTNNSDGRPEGLLAAGHAIGCVARDVTADGPTTLDRAQVFPGRVELPYKAGDECTLDPLPEAFEAEGAGHLLLSGTGALTSGTAINTGLSFKDGKVYVAQTGDVVQYKLSGKPDPVDAGELRIYAERV